jgi:hypothetical protein
VLTEVLYRLNFSIVAQCAALDFVLESVVEIVPASTKSLKKTKNLFCVYPNEKGNPISGHLIFFWPTMQSFKRRMVIPAGFELVLPAKSAD